MVNEKFGMENYHDVLYSDRLNHASIIDGQRLCRSEVVDKKIYNHADMSDLERQLEEDKNKEYRFRIIVTDGVFSMEGDIAPLPAITALAKKYNALVFVDDSHAIGVCGKHGRGTPEATGTFGKIDVLTGTLGKAIGGAAGGYISGTKEMISYSSAEIPAIYIFEFASAIHRVRRDGGIRFIVKRSVDCSPSA